MRHFLLTVLGLSCVAGASAQLTAADAFTSAPASVFPLLDRNTRLDMVDYVKSGLSTPSANALKGSSTITAMSPGALSVRMTDSSTAQVIVLLTFIPQRAAQLLLLLHGSPEAEPFGSGHGLGDER